MLAQELSIKEKKKKKGGPMLNCTLYCWYDLFLYGSPFARERMLRPVECLGRAFEPRGTGYKFTDLLIEIGSESDT
jgi:hypothetical protein